MSAAVDLRDPAWFPVDLHVPERRVAMLRIDAGVLERSTFLDTRIEAPLAEATWIGLDGLATPTVETPPGWLFHTSFCCSTLLARALHVEPRHVVLREPLVLRRLGDARHAGWPIESLVAPVVSLLSRPSSGDGSVVIKPTHAALNVGRELLAAAPASRALMLTSALDDFLVSNIKKTAETQRKIPELAERALNAGTFGRRCGPAALAPPDLLAAAALQWAAQRELCVDLVVCAGISRIRTLDAAQLLDDPVSTSVGVAAWLGYRDAPAVSAHAADVARRNAKAPTVAYGPAERERDARALRTRHGPALAAAIAWFERHVAPHMRDAALRFPELAPLQP
jgi:hypothetical protein